MANYPTQNEIRYWSAYAIDIFDSIMPYIDKPYPSIHIATAKTFQAMRAELVEQTGCTHTEIEEAEAAEAAIMEYIHGKKGQAILIRQNLIPGRDEYHFYSMLWHELGHFYAINSELTELKRYSNPGVVDDSRNIELTDEGPVMGMSDERLKQEGYWFWQEFIAEAISKYVSYKYRSAGPDYHPELIEWTPDIWYDVEDRLMDHLKNALCYHQFTIDEYSLAHYFANLLTDDFVLLYVKAAADEKLMIYDENGRTVVYPDEPIEPTCISDIQSTKIQQALWDMKKLLEQQVAKDQFWMIDENFLLDIGTCIGQMMFHKIVK